MVRKPSSINHIPPVVTRFAIALIIIGILFALPQILEWITRQFADQPASRPYGPLKTSFGLLTGIAIFLAGCVILVLDGKLFPRRKND